MWRLAGACEKSPSRSLLFHKEGPRKNKFFFPFCHFVVLSNISRDNILRRKDQNISEIFKTDNTLFRDELVDLENASADEIRNTLMRFFDPYWEITPLSHPNRSMFSVQLFIRKLFSVTCHRNP